MKIKIALLIICFSLLLCGCISVDSAKNTDDIFTDDKYIIDILNDRYGNPIQKTVYDTSSGFTYIYTFTYEKDLDFICKESSVTILDRNGNIIS